MHIPVVLTLLNREDGFDDYEIRRVPVLARREVAEGGWVKRVEPSTRVDAWLVDVFAPALACSPPVPLLDLLPLGLEAGVGLLDWAANGMRECLSRSTRALFLQSNICSPLLSLQRMYEGSSFVTRSSASSAAIFALSSSARSRLVSMTAST